MRALVHGAALVLAAASLLGSDAARSEALSSPTPAPVADSCPATPEPGLSPAAGAMARLQQRLAAEAAAQGGDAPIVLNGRGYNYGPARDPLHELQLLEAERARARSRR